MNSTGTREKPALVVNGLRKHFGAKTVLAELDLQVKTGDIVGLVGANGAGKTTFLRLLAGIIEPDAGTILLNGIPLASNLEEGRRQLGLVPDEPAFMEYLTAHELLTMAGLFYGLPEARLTSNIPKLLSLWDLSLYQHELIRTLSHGMKQKLWLTLALLPSPSILLLDEPFSGLDVHSCAILRELLRLEARAGKAILISSHTLSLVEEICRRIVILENSKFVFDGTVSDTLDKTSMEALVLRHSPHLPDPTTLAHDLYQTFSVFSAPCAPLR